MNLFLSAEILKRFLEQNPLSGRKKRYHRTAQTKSTTQESQKGKPTKKLQEKALFSQPFGGEDSGGKRNRMRGGGGSHYVR